MYAGEHGRRFNAITAKSMDARFDESSFAGLVARHAQLEWHLATPTIEDFYGSVDDVIYAQEEPFNGPSIIMQYFVFKKAKEIGCTVMLDGQGGDETLLGYEKYYPAAYIDYWRSTNTFRTISEIYMTTRNNHNMPLKAILFYSFGALFSKLRKKEHLRRCSFLKVKSNGHYGILDELADTYLDVNRLQMMEIQRTNLTTLLKYEDKNSMHHAIESRLPFLDYQTLETALGISTKYKIKGGWTKYLLRKAMETEMPGDIVWRKNKLGFNAPEALWINAYYPKMVEYISKSAILEQITDIKRLLNSYARLDNKMKWRIFNIARWENLYDVSLA
jgi:asparagine synthase (glutamine-hydrolysing)